MSKYYLTKEGLKKIKEELEHVKRVKLPQAQQRYSEAVKYGDDSRFEYKDAKEERDFYKSRIKHLTEMIETAKII